MVLGQGSDLRKMKSLNGWLTSGVLCLSCCLGVVGCGKLEPEMAPMESREAENVSPEMLDRALQGLHSQDAKLQITGLRFLESFPEIRQQHLARVEELSKSGKDASVRAQAAKILKQP